MTKAEHVALLEQLAQYAPQRLKDRVAIIVTEMLAPAAHPQLEKWASEAEQLSRDLRGHWAFAVPQWVRSGAFAAEPAPAAPQTLADVQREMDVAAEVASQSATEHREALADVMLSALKKRKAPKVS